MIKQSRLPFLLKHEVIATYQDGAVFILDRRKFPAEVEWYRSLTVEETVKALKLMVTQGGGPLEAALWTMVMADDDKLDLFWAKEELKKARPTNLTLSYELDWLLDNRKDNIRKGVLEIIDKYDEIYEKLSDYGESLLENGDGILTTCFPEHSFILSMLKAEERGKHIKVYVPETRPYLQGARLTRPSLEEIGIETIGITDNLVASYMEKGEITKFMTASDVAFIDKTVFNKIGTLQNAILSSYYKIPYYAFSVALETKRKVDEVIIEEHRAEELNEFMGEKISSRIYGTYPLFDKIPSSLVSGIITNEGIIK